MWNKIKSKLIHDDIQRNQETFEKYQNYSCESSQICKDITLSYEEECAGENLFKDVEMFEDYYGNNNNTVFSTFDFHLTGSPVLLKMLLSKPITNVNILSSRQSVIKQFPDDTKELLIRLKELEQDVLWLFVEKDDNLQHLYDIIYYKWIVFDKLNDIPSVLTTSIFYKILISPLIGVLSPFVYFLVPYLVLYFKFGVKISFVAYLKFMYSSLLQGDVFGMSGSTIRWVNIISQLFSLLFYFQGIFNSVELANTFHKVSKHLTNKMNSVAEFLDIVARLQETCWNNDITTCFFNIKPIETPFTCNFTPKPFSLFSNFGKQIKAFKRIDLDKLKHSLQLAYVIDTLQSVKSYKEKMQASFASYVQGTQPTINVEGVWHPCIPSDIAVRNSIQASNNNNVIITGPNAGGKSTFIKAVLVNMILCQTLGLFMGSNVTMSPFHMIHSQINLPDTKGKESLFEAEMYRCKKILDILKENPNKTILVVMDEIFNSTNPIEGIAGAYSIIKKISEYPNSLLIFTTHYAYLTKLQKGTNKFTNYKMNIDRDKDKIVYLYKLERGISKQYIALELLQLNGFDNDIINDALKIKAKFTT